MRSILPPGQTHINGGSCKAGAAFCITAAAMVLIGPGYRLTEVIVISIVTVIGVVVVISVGLSGSLPVTVVEVVVIVVVGTIVIIVICGVVVVMTLCAARTPRCLEV